MQKGQRRRRKRNPTTSAARLTFFIEAMDALGQGVSKQDGQVVFVAGALPGERGTARVVSRKKGVTFAQLETLDQAAGNRTTPACPHYGDCPGCDYLHTDYASELDYKKAALLQLLHGLPVAADDIVVTGAPQRLHYRNRLQLHYRHKYLGMLDGINDRVVEIPHCQLAEPALQPALDALYADKSWAATRSGQGHCELALAADAVQLAWDESYAHTGFSQVNSAMNTVLCRQVAAAVLASQPATLLDLFAGNGNLSHAIVEAGNCERLMVDVSEHEAADFIRLDLFADDALAQFRRRCPQRQFDTVLIDPPRKGFAALDAWLKALRPRQLVYVSCNAATLARDLKNLSLPYRIEAVQLLDLFPATRHFETLVSLRLDA